MSKKLDKKIKLNIYSTNFWMDTENNDKNKLLLHKLSNSLKDNQWLNLSSDNPDNYNYTRKIKCYDNTYYSKPQGTWYSKGEWLFHGNNDNNSLSNSYISLVEVDYSKIYKITNKPSNNYKLLSSYYKSLDNFINIYSKKLRNTKNTKKNIYIKKNGVMVINWQKLCNKNKYNGIAIYPLPPHQFYSNYIKTNNIVNFLTFWNVSSLCLWNMSSITNHHNLGKFKDIGDIDNLIKKINKINEINEM